MADGDNHFLPLQFAAATQIFSGCAALRERPPMIESRIVEAACGQCQFAMPGIGCDLAVRIDGEDYFVDGTGIDDHGDAHGNEGLCNAVRNARVSGEVRNGRFVSTAFELLPQDGLRQD
jgi:hypothetical protein